MPSHGKKTQLTRVDRVDHDQAGDPLFGFTPPLVRGWDKSGDREGPLSPILGDCFVWILNKHHFHPDNSEDHFRDPPKRQSKHVAFVSHPSIWVV